MPRRDNLRPLRRVFNRATEFARKIGADDMPFDKQYQSLTPRTLVEMATCSPSLKAPDARSRINAIQASMVVLAAAELKLQEELENEQAAS